MYIIKAMFANMFL